MSKLTIVANIKAKSDKIELVKAELEKLIDKGNPAHFLFYENWESRECWQTHMGNQHLADYLAATEGAVEEFTVNEMMQIA